MRRTSLIPLETQRRSRTFLIALRAILIDHQGKKREEQKPLAPAERRGRGPAAVGGQEAKHAGHPWNVIEGASGDLNQLRRLKTPRDQMGCLVHRDEKRNIRHQVKRLGSPGNRDSDATPSNT